MAQETPMDSVILKVVFGKTDKEGKTYSKPFEKSARKGINTYENNIIWKIVFKSKVKINNQDLIFAIIEANDFTQHGHQWGYRNMYFLSQTDGKIELIDSIIENDEILLGDNSSFEIIDIGKHKKALVVQFSSTGNQHFESSKSINLLELNKLTFLLSTESYDNSAWKFPESENDDCNAKKYGETYEILKSDNEWYDIKIHHIDYGFTNGCKDWYIKSENDKIYYYSDGKYKEKINN